MVRGFFIVGGHVGFLKLFARGAKIGLEGGQRLPLAGANDADGSIAQVGKVGFGRRYQQGDELDRRLALEELAGKGRAILEVAAAEDRFCAGGIDLVDEGAEVGSLGVVPFEEHHLVALLLSVILGRRDDGGGEFAVFVHEGDLGDGRVGGLQQIHRTGQVAAGRGVDLVNAGVALLVDAVGSRAGGDHHLAVLFGNQGRRCGQAAGVGADHEVGVVFRGQAGVEFLYAVGGGFVVVRDVLEFDDRAVAQLNAAGLIDLLHPELEAVDLPPGGHVVLAGDRSRVTDGDDDLLRGAAFTAAFAAASGLAGVFCRGLSGGRFGFRAAGGQQQAGRYKQNEQDSKKAFHRSSPPVVCEMGGVGDKHEGKRFAAPPL